MARAERLCKTENDATGDNVFDVSRPSILSNPFTHIKDKKTLAKRVVKDKNTALELYEEYFNRMVDSDEAFRKEFDRIYEAYKKYDIIYLKCYCPLDERCHADFIIKQLSRRLVKSKIEEVLESRREEEGLDNEDIIY